MSESRVFLEFSCIPSDDPEECQVGGNIFYSITFSSLISFIIFLIAMALIAYRWRYGLFSGLYRRVDNYWVPTAIDSFIVYISVGEFTRAAGDALLLLDWSSMIFHTMISTIWTVATCNAVAMFTVGIISYIPSTFTHYTHIYDKAPRILDFFKSSPAGQSHAIILVPSTKILFWSSLLFSVQMIVGNIAIGIWYGWVIEYESAAAAFTIHSIHLAWITISMVVIMLVNGYYCYKFYCLLQAHVDKQKCNIDDQKDAARRYRNIFLTVVVMFLLFSCFEIVIGTMNKWLYKSRTLRFTVVISYYSVIHPMLGLIILYNIWQTTRLQVRRSTSLSLPSASAKTPPATRNTPVCYSKKSATLADSVTNNYDAVMDPTLIWQTFISADLPANSTTAYKNQLLGNNAAIDSNLIISSDIHQDQ